MCLAPVQLIALSGYPAQTAMTADSNFLICCGGRSTVWQRLRI